MAYPTIKHTRILDHDILGTVKVYEFPKGRLPRSQGSGCQSDFYRNGANPNNSKQYGIKLFNTSIEAFAAYQRQRLAAEEGLAPPVGKMVLWVIRYPNTKNRDFSQRNRWGYETCIADTSAPACRLAMILASPRIRDDYGEYCRNRNTPLDSMYSESSIQSFWKNVDMNWDLYEYDSHNALSDVKDSDSIRYQIANINIVGTQYDDVSDAFENDEKWNDRLRLGNTWLEDDYPFMSNDLHTGNIGLWKKNPVIIDFGYHIACPAYRNFDE